MQPAADLDQPISERALSKLKWRCRRGLLENDLFIERFFERHEAGLTVRQAQALETLMDLSDNDLLDLLLRRKEPEPEWAGADVIELLQLMRTDGAQSRIFLNIPLKDTRNESIRHQSHPVVQQRQPERRAADLQGHHRART